MEEAKERATGETFGPGELSDRRPATELPGWIVARIQTAASEAADLATSCQRDRLLFDRALRLADNLRDLRNKIEGRF